MSDLADVLHLADDDPSWARWTEHVEPEPVLTFQLTDYTAYVGVPFRNGIALVKVDEFRDDEPPIC